MINGKNTEFGAGQADQSGVCSVVKGETYFGDSRVFDREIRSFSNTSISLCTASQREQRESGYSGGFCGVYCQTASEPDQTGKKVCTFSRDVDQQVGPGSAGRVSVKAGSSYMNASIVKPCECDRNKCHRIAVCGKTASTVRRREAGASVPVSTLRSVSRLKNYFIRKDNNVNLIIHKSVIFSLIVVLALAACQKTGTVPSVAKPAALTIVNAIPTAKAIIPIINTSSSVEYFNTAAAINYGSFSEFSPYGGIDTLYAVQKDVDTLDISPKAGQLMFYNILNLQPGGIYSLFFAGTDTSAPDYLFTVDTLPVHNSTDSTFDLRFVNLSTDSDPVSVDINGDSNGSEVASLAYKGVSSFKAYSASSTAAATYTFEFRDLASGKLLSSYKFSGILNGTGGNSSSNIYRFRNFTLALIGQPSGIGAIPQKAILINNY